MQRVLSGSHRRGEMIKVCGMREPENIREVAQLPIDLMGGIFYHKSPRFIGDRTDTAEAFSTLPESVKPVGVFVNAELSYLAEMKEKFSLKYLQLHGNESPEFCCEAGKTAPVIKAFGLNDEFDFSKLRDYESAVELFIFDTSCKEHGGSGKKFDWEILSKYRGTTPFLLSGGIGPDDVDAIRSISHPSLRGVDLNSGFESRPAYKELALLSPFVKEYLA